MRRLAHAFHPLAGVTSFGYTPAGLTSSVTDAGGNTTTYGYDSAGRVIATVSPDTGTTSYAYNPGGTLSSKTDANGTAVTYAYDTAERLTQIAFPNASENITFTYDSASSSNGLGRLTNMADPSGTTVYHYDLLGRVTQEVQTVLGVAYTTAYAYDSVGNLTAITYPSGRVVEYTYTSLNRPDHVQTTKDSATQVLASGIVYDPAGNRISLALGNGLIQTNTYDPANRVTAITVPGVTGYGFGYDAVGNVASWTDDASLTFSPIAGTTTYGYQTNRLMNVTEGVTVSTYAYDSAGNPTTDGGRQFVYNQNQRLIRVSAGASVLGEYTYDGQGRRVIKTASGITTINHYDRQGRLIEETDGAGNLLVDYVYLEGRPLAMIRKAGAAEQTYYYHTDHLGTPKAMTDASQAIVWQVAFDPFGNVTGGSVQNVENNLRFPGQYLDQETGLNYNYFRDYDPKTGRYVQSDPIGLLGGVNTYSYVRGNPLRLKDPSGLWFGIDDAAFIGVGAALGVAGRFIGDVVTGNRSTIEDYGGAATGGALGGEALLYTANPFIAGATAGLAGNLTAQALKNVSGKQCGVDFGSAAFDTGFGALTGFIPGRPKLMGVNAGRGSDIQVFRQIITKAQNGTIDRITAATAWRMLQGAYYEYAFGQAAAAGAIGSTVFSIVGP